MKKLTLLLLLGIPFMAFAQPKTDSLIAALKIAPAQDKINIYEQIINGLTKDDPTKAITYGKALIAYADSAENPKGKALGYRLVATIYDRQGNHWQDLKYWKANLKIEKELDNRKNIAYTYMAIGSSLQDLSEFDKAFAYFDSCQVILEEINDQRGLRFNYSNIGIAYEKIGLITKAVETKYKALQIAEQLGDSISIAQSLASVAVSQTNLKEYQKAIDNYTRAIEIYERIGKSHNVVHIIANLGVVYNTLNENQKAMEAFRKGLSLSNDINYPYGRAIVQMNMGEILLEMNRPDSAMYFLTESNKTFTGLKILHPLCYNYKVMGTWYKKAGHYQNATNYMLKAYNLSQEIDAPDMHRDAAKGLSEIYEHAGEFAKALQYQKIFKHYSDSLFNAENIAATAQLESKYLYEKKQTKTELLHRAQLEKKQIALIAATTGMLVVLVLLVFVFFQYRSKNAAYKVLYKKNMEQLKAAGNNRKNEGLKNGELYIEIERKMKEEKLFTTKNLSRELIAEKLNTNHEYVQKAIKDHAAKTVNEYINGYRIGEAMEILSDPIKMKNEKMANLAGMVGFNSVSTFNKTFKEITGMSPSEFRKQSAQ